jgi:hypothetical protein
MLCGVMLESGAVRRSTSQLRAAVEAVAAALQAALAAAGNVRYRSLAKPLERATTMNRYQYNNVTMKIIFKTIIFDVVTVMVIPIRVSGPGTELPSPTR